MLSMRRGLWGALVLMAWVLVERPARADENEDFRRQYQQALSLYEGGKYEESIAAFQRAYALRQLPRLLLNLGQLHRKLGRARAALGYYELYLRVEPNPEPKLRVELDRYIQQTRTMLDAAQRIQAESEAARKQAAQERRLDAASPPLQAGREESASAASSDSPSVAPGAASAPGVGEHAASGQAVGSVRPADPAAGTQVAAVPSEPGHGSRRPAMGESGAAPPDRMPAHAKDRPLHKQWWFWTLLGIGGAGLVAGITAAVAASQPTVPASPLGTVRVFALGLGRWPGVDSRRERSP
jgi:hypothetical protein